MALTFQEVAAKYGITAQQAQRLGRCDKNPNDNKVDDFILKDFERYQTDEYINQSNKESFVHIDPNCDRKEFAVFWVESKIYEHQTKKMSQNKKNTTEATNAPKVWTA